MRSYFKSLSKTQAVWEVKLNMPDGQRVIFCPEDMYIIDAAEKNLVEIPYAARAGADAVSGGKLVSGAVDQSAQSFLNVSQITNGYVLLDVAIPISNCEIETHKEQEIMDTLN
ncbi:ferredoxin [Sphingobacterium sp. MYb388]|uniref:ferredoxin n=1 Tax=Sphingobacterium sp. MYb388 TaxID=2745437 RepID=UPI0030B7919C